MKKKTVSILAITMMLGLTMPGCAKTPDQALVAQKNHERLEAAAKEEPKDGTTLKDIAATANTTYDFSYESEDGKISIQAEQVPVTLPAKDSIPMYHVSCGEISQTIADKVYDYFFPDGGYTTTGTDITKAEIDKRILEIQQTIANYRDDPEISDEEKEEIIQTNEAILEALEEEREKAPEESTLSWEPRDSTYSDREYDSVEGTIMVKELSVNSKDNKKWLYIASSDASSSFTSTLQYSDGNAWEYSSDNGTPVAMCRDEELQKIGISQKNAAAIVEDFIAAIGMNWEIHDTFCVRGYKVTDNKEDGEEVSSDHYTAYQFVLSQTIDGIQSAVTSSSYLPEDNSAVAWLYEQIRIIVEPDGIVKVDWNYPLTVDDTVSDNVGIISFDAARDIFENMMPLVAKGDLEKWNEEYLETTAKLTVSDVRLGLMRVRNSGSELTGLMTPVWIFYGDYNRSFHYLPGAEALPYGGEDDSSSEPHPWILLAVNAVDGSVIDITEGY
ncbi:MAG: DUF6034 family protein [Clostridiales bacterium]|nr:DUF6034 family protein [Clostridiales bacterium]